MKLKIYSKDGKSSKEKEVKTIKNFEGNQGIRALKDVIIAFMANNRQGNASSKTRSEVRGGGRKPWRQKGTGMARAGSRRSPIWKGGGVAHGPKPRDFTQKINSKVKKLAINRAMFDCAAEGDLSLIEEFAISEPKTKAFNEIMANINKEEKNLLLIDEAFSENVLLASRNNTRLFTIDADSVNAWDIVKHDKVLVTEKGFDKLMKRINPQD